MSAAPKVMGLAGWSGSGKTTLARALIAELASRGHRVSTIKHAHHNFDIDQPGKDSYEHRQAGASEVLVSSANRWALMHELRGDAEPTLWELLSKLAPVELVLVEGFKRETHQKLEIHRPDLGQPLLAAQDPNVVAIASDAEMPEATVPVLDLNNVPAIADFVVKHCRLREPAPEQGAA